MEAARFLEELTAAGVTLDLRGGELAARGPVTELERFSPRLKALKPALVALLTSHKVKCRDCKHATPAATCARGHDWIGAQLLHRCPDFEPRPKGDEWRVAPLVRCRDCKHFRPHPTNRREGHGTCRLDESLQWPWQREHRCAGFEKGKN